MGKKRLRTGDLARDIQADMLLAQFIGIVHEIKLGFLASRGDLDDTHLSPVLIALGHFSENSASIVADYNRRGIHVTIAENYDMRLGPVKRGAATNSFEKENDLLVLLTPMS